MTKAERVAAIERRRIEVRAEFFAYEENDVLELIEQFQRKLKRLTLKINKNRKLREKDFDDQIAEIEGGE